jgi:thiol:disulfide interchange protein DsbC
LISRVYLKDCLSFEEVDLEFKSGLNIFTGPSGAGKSILMQAIWCSQDRKAAFDQAAQGLPVASAECKNPVRDQYQLGLNMGVNGTPAIYNVEGVYLGGYMTPDEIIKRLEK